jgi:ribosomal protein S18 acetylase RimI-like enzyme
MIRTMNDGDVEQVVALHMRSFPGFFLTFLGPRFLRLMYRGIAEDEGGVMLVADSGGAIEGFAAGVKQQSGFYSRLLRRAKWSFAFAAASAVLRRPTVVPRLFRALRRPAESVESAAEACLMSIAVDPARAGGGVGKALANAFCDEMARVGAPAVCLTTDRDGNEAVNSFYERLGFTLVRSFRTPEGRWMNEYVKSTVPGA